MTPTNPDLSSLSRVTVWTGPASLRVWRLRWTADGWRWIDPAASDESERDEPVYCERCGDERGQDPVDRPNDPALDYAREKCIGEGGHIWPLNQDASRDFQPDRRTDG